MENVIVVLFKEESTTYEALSELKTRTGQSSTLEAAIVKKDEGSITTKEAYSWANDEHFSSWIAGGLIGGLIGIIGGPVGMLLGSSMGMIVGSTADVDEELYDAGIITTVAKKLESGQTALIVIADELNTNELDDFFNRYDKPTILRRDVAAVQIEVYQAEDAEAELREKAVEKMYGKKKEEWHEKAEAEKNKIQQDFINLRNKIETSNTVAAIANEFSAL